MPTLGTFGAAAARGFGLTAGVSAFRYSITSDTANVDLRAAIVSAGWDGAQYVIATIQSGVTVFSASTGSYAMTISGSFPAGLLLVNNGTILGRGGDGGRGHSDPTVFNTVGGNGGPALLVQTAVSINNLNRIAGGGGGGGGGALTRDGGISAFCAGGGGGGGIGNGSGGQGGVGSGTNAAAGQNGTLVSAGSGGEGVRYYVGGAQGGTGGTGGGFGSSGASGTGPVSGTNFGGPSVGGTAGAAVVGNSNITWIATGTRNGSIS